MNHLVVLERRVYLACCACSAQPHQMRSSIVKRTYMKCTSNATYTRLIYVWGSFKGLEGYMTVGRERVYDRRFRHDVGLWCAVVTLDSTQRHGVAWVAVGIDFDISATLCYSPFTASEFFHANFHTAVRIWCCVFVLLASVRVFVCLSVRAKTEKNYRAEIIVTVSFYIRPILLLVLLSVCACVCVCVQVFLISSVTMSNIIRVVWYFVMSYCVLYHFNLRRLHSNNCVVYLVCLVNCC